MLGCENSHVNTFLNIMKEDPDKYRDVNVIGVYSEDGEAFADQVLFNNIRCDHVYAHIAHALSILKCIYSPHVDNSAVCVHQINKLFCEIGIIDARINIVLKYKRDIILAYITGQQLRLGVRV